MLLKGNVNFSVKVSTKLQTEIADKLVSALTEEAEHNDDLIITRDDEIKNFVIERHGFSDSYVCLHANNDDTNVTFIYEGETSVALLASLLTSDIERHLTVTEFQTYHKKIKAIEAIIQSVDAALTEYA